MYKFTDEPSQSAGAVESERTADESTYNIETFADANMRCYTAIPT